MADNVKDPATLTPRQLWSMEVKSAEEELKKFHDRGEKANARYLDERDTMDAEAKKFNIFYANTNILQSALYSQVPKPAVSRRYTDYRDQVGRVAALILERALGQDLNDPSDQFDATMRQCVQDRLVPGIGTAWLRLETDTEDIPESEGGQLTNDTQSTSPEATPDDGFTVPAQTSQATLGDPLPAGNELPLQKIVDQRVAVDYVYWRDFIFSPCRVWSERRWVGRRTYLTEAQLTRRFGEEKAKLCSLDYTKEGAISSRDAGSTTPKKEVLQKAVVYEIWDRTTRKVVWYAPGFPEKLLDEKDDFLHLTSFEPCPMPMFANISTSNCTPRPDYYMIQDQYQELDTVNARISILVQACKVVGIYPKNGADSIGKLFQGAENTMIPVDNWAQFSEKGGVKGQVDWIPLEMVVVALQRLGEAREVIKGQIYELTGIADIVRGASKASETLGAQQIKAQFASIRIKRLQDEVARFASEILRIKAEIMVKHFDVGLLIRRSGISRTDNDDYVVDAVVTVKSEEGFQWRVVVQSDSMAQADYAQDKKDRIEFMSAISGYMGNALPMTLQMPETKPIVLGVLKWGLAAFHEAEDIEGMLEKQLALMEGKPPPPPPQDPKIAAAQMKSQQDQQKGQQDMAIADHRAQLDSQKQQSDISMKQQTMQMENAMMQQKMGFEKEMNDMKMAMERFKLEMIQATGQQKMAVEQQKGAIDIQKTQVQGALDIQHSTAEHDLAMQTSADTAAQSLDQSKEAHTASLAQQKAVQAAKPKVSK